MRNLGPAIITDRQQRDLADGRMMNLARVGVFADAAEQAQPGDIFWVKEGYWEVTAEGEAKRHAIVQGPIFGAAWPDHLRPHTLAANGLKRTYRQAGSMSKADSRACLEILSEIDRPFAGWLCRVHLRNVSDMAGAA